MSADLAEYERVRARIDGVADAVRDILDASRQLVLPDTAPHTYSDKFLLVESAVASSLARVHRLLRLLGLTEQQAHQLVNDARHWPVKLELTVVDRCEFVKETVETAPPPNGAILETSLTSSRDEQNSTVSGGEDSSSSPGKKSSIFSGMMQHRVLHRTTTYHWHMTQSVCFAVRVGGGAGNGTAEEAAQEARQELLTRTYEMEMTTKAKENPRKAQLKSPQKQFIVDISYLFRAGQPGQHFKIDRTKATCRTPGYNDDVRDCTKFFDGLDAWLTQVGDLFAGDIFQVELARSGVNLVQVPLEQAFTPVVPLMEAVVDVNNSQHPQNQDQHSVSVAIKPLTADFDRLVACIDLSMARGVELVRAALAHTPHVENSCAYHQVSVLMTHLVFVCRDYRQSVAYVNGLVAQQLVDAIGKIVRASDLTAFTSFHNRRLFRGEFVPRPLCHDVRRAGYTPEGSFAIEFADSDSDSASPISIVAMQRQVESPRPLRLALSATNSVQLNGQHFMHGYIAHQFSTELGATGYQLAGRARQFSCFLLLLGTIGTGNTFDCKEGLLLQNKDEIVIPLLLETIPSAAEFRDAISSLSPEQQRFAKAFREMQIASTIFAVAIVQVKPQLEKVLKLPPDSLTKEIRLTQDLMQLFTEHQIPTDLLSFSGQDAATATVADKIKQVKENVASVKSMILGPTEAEELAERLARANLRKAESVSTGNFGAWSGSAPPQSAPAPGLFSTGFGSRAPTVSEGFSFGALAATAQAPMAAMKRSAPQPVVMCAAPPPPPTPAPPVMLADVAAPPPVHNDNEAATSADMSIIDAREYQEDQADGVARLDFTRIPAEIEANFERYDAGNSCNVRPTKIKIGGRWRKKAYDRAMKQYKQTVLDGSDSKAEVKCGAMDLLDALTRSGELPVDDCSVHVVYAATHCFDETVFDTVVRCNINPIERMERSTLIMASAVHGLPVDQLVSVRETARLHSISPMLFAANSAEAAQL